VWSRTVPGAGRPCQPAHRRLDGATIRQLGESLRGPLLQPGDQAYEAARRIDNAMIDRRPALMARCAGVADVKRQYDPANFFRMNQNIRPE
jgi:Berberine and berberine like